MRRTAAALLVLAAVAAPAFAKSYPTHVPVTLTRIPGNICCPHQTRVHVSATGVLTTYRRNDSGMWIVVKHRNLTGNERFRLRTELARFNPATLKPNNSAGCHGLPIGDVGGDDLRVGKHASNCPPNGANRLIKVMSAWLPKS